MASSGDVSRRRLPSMDVLVPASEAQLNRDMLRRYRGSRRARCVAGGSHAATRRPQPPSAAERAAWARHLRIGQ